MFNSEVTSSGRNYQLLLSGHKEFQGKLERLGCRSGVKIDEFVLSYKGLMEEFVLSIENNCRVSRKKKSMNERIIKLSQKMNRELERIEQEGQHIEIMTLERERQNHVINQSRRDLDSLKLEYLKLTKELEFSTKYSSNEYIEFRAQCLAKRNAKVTKVNELENKKKSLYEIVSRMRKQDQLVHSKHKKLQKQLERVRKKNKESKHYLVEIESMIAAKSRAIELKKQQLEDKKNMSLRMDVEVNNSLTCLQALKIKILEFKEREKKLKEIFKSKTQHLQHSVEETREAQLSRDKMITRNAKLETSNEKLGEEIMGIDQKILEVVKKGNMTETQKHSMFEKRKLLIKKKEELLLKKAGICLDLDKLREEIYLEKKGHEKMKGELDELNHQKNILVNQISTEQKDEDKKKEITTVLLTRKRNLILSISLFRKEAESDRKTIYLLKEQIRVYKQMVRDTSEKCENVEQKMEILKLNRESLESKIENEKKELKKQQQLYEEVENDRNTLFKKLSRIEMLFKVQQKKFSLLLTTIKHIKSEISKRDIQIQDYAVDAIQLDQENERLNKTNEKYEALLERNKRLIQEKNQIIYKLREIIRNAQENRKKQQREVYNLINERDILGNNLLQRNKQIFDLYEKIKLNIKEINDGKFEFQKKKEKIELLKVRIRCLLTRTKEISLIMDTEKAIKSDISKLRKKLTDVKMKMTAILDESNIKLNIHGYRKLKSTHPEVYKLLESLQRFRKEHYNKSKSLEEIDFLIKEKEILYKQLRISLDRQPTIGDHEQLIVLKRTLQRKILCEKQTKRNLKESNLLLASEKTKFAQYKLEYSKLSNTLKKRHFNSEL